MPFLLCCSGCHANLQIPDDATGKLVRCPRCKFVFSAKKPAPPAPRGPAAVEPVDGQPPRRETCVFISHAAADQQFVDTEVHQFFKNHDIATWYSSHDIAGGANWLQEIMEGLNKSDWFVLVLSPRAVGSVQVRKEVELALETKPDRILPILMAQCAIKDLHPELLAIQYQDFTKDVALAQRRLLVSMLRRLNVERQDWEQKAGRQGQTIEDLKGQLADFNTAHRDLEGKVQRAASFDGHWSDGAGHGTIPRFIPLKDRRVPIVALCNFKGGVGKTTMTANLGATLWGDAFRKRVLLIDLDYQSSLSSLCLDGKVRLKLAQQHRLVQELFTQAKPDARLLLQSAHEVSDSRTRNHEGFIIAADDDLLRAEAALLARWMIEDEALDARYVLRFLLHTDVVQNNFDIVLLDCPPRMTAAAVNAFLAADYLLIPTPLEDVSTEAVPRLLRWVGERKKKLLAHLNLLGVVVSRTKVKELLNHEKELLDTLREDCKDAWGGIVRVYKTYIPAFPAAANSYQYPAQHASLRGVFAELLKEMTPALSVGQKAPAVAKK
jgi:cellulose biosynthesis protein BcsQ